MTEVVRQADDGVCQNVFAIFYIPELQDWLVVFVCDFMAFIIYFVVSISLDGFIVSRQQDRIGWEFIISSFVVLVLGYADIRHRLKQSSFSRSQFIPIPITDRIVQLVFYIVDNQFLITTQLHTIRIIIGISVGLYIQQLHSAMRSSRDGQRKIHHLTVGIGRTGISRDILVIDIDRTPDIPVVGRHTVWAFIPMADVIAVVYDGLRTVHKVT